jgi:hypothetical protein
MKHRMEPIPFAGPIELAQARLREVIQGSEMIEMISSTIF